MATRISGSQINTSYVQYEQAYVYCPTCGRVDPHPTRVATTAQPIACNAWNTPAATNGYCKGLMTLGTQVTGVPVVSPDTQKTS
jgi:hypothetical protein